MDDSLLFMDVLYGTEQLQNKTFSLDFLDFLPFSNQVVESPRLTELKKDVDVLRVLEEMREFDDVGVGQGFVHFDLVHDFHLVSGLA